MSNEQKTAINSAVKRIDDEKSEQLKNEVYQFLKQELEAVESLEEQIKELSEKRRVHEENIKNVKAGNLEAIRKRQVALNQPVQIWSWGNSTATFNPNWFYNHYLAGNVVVTLNGKKFIF